MLSTDIKKSDNTPLSLTHRAGWVLADSDQLIQNGYVTTTSGKITDVGQGSVKNCCSRTIDHGPGVLMPSLVNAHTHLELTALQNKIHHGQGFISWVKSIIDEKSAIGEQALVYEVPAGIEALKNSGTLVIGDISSAGLGLEAFTKSWLSGVWFREYLGPDSEDIIKCEKIRPDQWVSVAGHAPHTTSSDMLLRLKKAARAAEMPFSLHLSESVEEMEFMTTGKGVWLDFLKERGVDPAIICRSGASPVAYADQLGLLDETTLAVHLVFADKKDIKLLGDRNVPVCLCPRSNQLLHHRLPDVDALVGAGLNLCLGTDSLASNDSLSLFDEMRFLWEAFPGFSPAQILSMVTIGGAKALGFGNRFGRLAKGFAAKMVYVPVSASDPENVLQGLAAGDFAGNVTCID